MNQVNSDIFRRIFESLTSHMALIDTEGMILRVNDSWREFAKMNDGALDKMGPGVNYLEVCRKSADSGDEFAVKAEEGIRKVIAGKSFWELEYPCHSPNEKHWYIMRVTRIEDGDDTVIVITHFDITKRKLAEIELERKSSLDGLTNLFNREYLDAFLDEEWRRSRRLHLPITAAMVDLDFFKTLNDTYGHRAGDRALVAVAGVLESYTRRPSDICARYGGEEFVLVFGNTTCEQILDVTDALLRDIRALGIANEESGLAPTLTASIGLATLYPDESNKPGDLIEVADRCLYEAKSAGRDRLVYAMERRAAARN